MDTRPNVLRHTLAEFFSKTFSFLIPWFQRSYAWEVVHALSLLEDIDRARKKFIANPENNNWYHLGMITLAKGNPARDGDVEMRLIVDGQQRIITLTILFAVLRDLIQDAELSASLNARIWCAEMEGGATSAGVGARAKPRVATEKTIRDCLEKYVMAEGATGNYLEVEEGIDPLKLDGSETIGEFNISETRVIANRMALRQALQSWPKSELSSLIRFLLNKVMVVALTVEDEDTARQIFTTAQQRGLELKPANVFKADVIDLVAPDKRSECSEVWEEYWSQLGAAKFAQLLKQMSVIKQGFGYKGTLESDLIGLYKIREDPVRFVHQDLGVLAQFTLDMRNLTLGEGDQFARLNRRLQYLGWVTHKTWMTPALYWLQTRGVDDGQTLEFFTALERFAYLEMLTNQQTSTRNAAYQAVLNGISDDTVLDPKGALDASKFVSEFKARLSSKNIGTKNHKTQIFLRANAAVEGDERVCKTQRLTVEHSLPKKPNKNSDWNDWFVNPADKSNNLQRLGNLLPLTRAENNDAGNKNYAVKRGIFENSVFALANEAAKNETWDADVIERRTQYIISLLLKAWDLEK